MNLIKSESYTEKEIKAVEVLAPSSQPFILALMDVKVLSIPIESCENYIYDILKLAEIQSGLTKIDNKDLFQLAEDTRQLILDQYPNITKAELYTAFRNGSLEMYGVWYGMCLKSVNQWIKGYIGKEARLKAIKEWNAQIEKSETSDKPLIDKMIFSKDACQKAFTWYKKYKELPFGAFAYYDIINDLIGEPFKPGYSNKTLIKDSDIRKKIIAGVTEKHTKNLLREKNKQERRGNLSQAEALMSVITADFKNSKSLENLIKIEFLKRYFDSIDSLILPE